MYCSSAAYDSVHSLHFPQSLFSIFRSPLFRLPPSVTIFPTLFSSRSFIFDGKRRCSSCSLFLPHVRSLSFQLRFLVWYCVSGTLGPNSSTIDRLSLWDREPSSNNHLCYSQSIIYETVASEANCPAYSPPNFQSALSTTRQFIASVRLQPNRLFPSHLAILLSIAYLVLFCLWWNRFWELCPCQRVDWHERASHLTWWTAH